nr:unnamed protein product [Digitaria exilis]
MSWHIGSSSIFTDHQPVGPYCKKRRRHDGLEREAEKARLWKTEEEDRGSDLRQGQCEGEGGGRDWTASDFFPTKVYPLFPCEAHEASPAGQERTTA